MGPTSSTVPRLYGAKGWAALGAVAGVIVVVGVNFLEWMRIDDPIGAVPVHGFCGIWGTWSLGLFACGQFGASGPISRPIPLAFTPPKGDPGSLT